MSDGSEVGKSGTRSRDLKVFNLELRNSGTALARLSDVEMRKQVVVVSYT